MPSLKEWAKYPRADNPRLRMGKGDKYFSEIRKNNRSAQNEMRRIAHPLMMLQALFRQKQVSNMQCERNKSGT